MWSCRQPQAVPMRTCWLAFSRCGQWLVALAETSELCGDRPRLVASIFSVAQRAWLYDMSLPDSVLGGGSSSDFVVSDNGHPLFACALISGPEWTGDQLGGDQLLVLGVSPPFVRRVQTGVVRALQRLPNTHSVVLLCDDSLARYDLLDPPDSLTWVRLPERDLFSWTAIAPTGHTLWVAQKRVPPSNDEQRCWCVHIAVYAARTLTCCGTWRLHATARSECPRLYASTQALALRHNYYVDVHDLAAPFVLGQHLYRLADSSLVFSADGCFFACERTVSKDVCALESFDAHTGAVINSQQAAAFLATVGVVMPGGQVSDWGLGWAACDPSQLLVTCSSGYYLLFCSLQY